MTSKNQDEHNAQVISQFTQQAIPFSKLSGHHDAMQMLVEMSAVKQDDIVLDVACGSGLVACAFARIAQHVTGVDLTEKMIEQAKIHQSKLGLTNLSWDIGTVSSLPYGSNSFSTVITRYSFHHFIEPTLVLNEMLRVCKPNGVVLIADVALPAKKADAYNHMEKLRDPSHTQALSFDDWEKLLNSSGLRNLQRSSYECFFPK